MPPATGSTGSVNQIRTAVGALGRTAPAGQGLPRAKELAARPKQPSGGSVRTTTACASAVDGAVSASSKSTTSAPPRQDALTPTLFW